MIFNNSCGFQKNKKNLGGGGWGGGVGMKILRIFL